MLKLNIVKLIYKIKKIDTKIQKYELNLKTS